MAESVAIFRENAIKIIVQYTLIMLVVSVVVDKLERHFKK